MCKTLIDAESIHPKLATEDELKDFHKLSQKSLEFWKDKKDDVYCNFYMKKSGTNKY